jgi:hypothetical protein
MCKFNSFTLLFTSSDELLMLVFRRSSQSKISWTKGLPEVIALTSANKIIALGVRPNEIEDLSISEMIWVADTLNDFVVGLDTGTPLLEDAQEDASLVIQAGPT